MVEGLAADVVDHSSHLGFHGDTFRPGQLSQLQLLSVTVSLANYRKGIEWLGNVFARSTFDAERVAISRARLVGTITEGLRDGSTVARNMIKVWKRKGRWPAVHAIFSDHTSKEDSVKKFVSHIE